MDINNVFLKNQAVIFNKEICRDNQDEDVMVQNKSK